MKTAWLLTKLALLMLIVAILLCFVAEMVSAPKAGATAPIAEERDRFVAPELRAICASESTGDWNAEPRHWDENGDVLRGRVNDRDVGQCQINLDVWGEKAAELGIDPLSYDGNVAMANWIYERYSNGPWYLSEAMWNK